MSEENIINSTVCYKNIAITIQCILYLYDLKVGEIITGAMGVKTRLITLESPLKKRFGVHLWRDKINLGDGIGM